MDKYQLTTRFMPQFQRSVIIAEVVFDRNGEKLLWVIVARSRATGYDDVCQFKKPAVIFPGGDVAERIETDDEKKLVIRLFLFQLSQGVDGKAGAGPFGFEVTGCKCRVVGYCQVDHRQPVAEADLFGNLLVGRDGGRQEENLVEVAMAEGRFGNMPMRIVDRVERPSENADSHLSFRCVEWLVADLAVTKDNEFTGCQILEAHRAKGVQLGCRNADLGAEPELVAIGEAR